MLALAVVAIVWLTSSRALTVREARAWRAAPLAMLLRNDLPAVLAPRAWPALRVVADRPEVRALSNEVITKLVAAFVPDEDTSYAAWAARHFTSAELADARVSGPEAIYGPDGMTNLLKYSLGLHPKQDGTPALPKTDEIDGHWFHTFAASAAPEDIVLRVEASNDLENWSAEGVTLEPISLEGGRIVWQAHYQGDREGAVIFRLNVSLR